MPFPFIYSEFNIAFLQEQFLTYVNEAESEGNIKFASVIRSGFLGSVGSSCDVQQTPCPQLQHPQKLIFQLP